MSSTNSAAHLLVTGRVQGVGYRYFALEAANALGLRGWVRNRSEGSVECQVEGSRLDIETFLETLREGPPLSRVDDVQVNWRAYSGSFGDFSIR